MSKRWTDIIRDRLQKRSFKAQKSDWQAMESLLDQHIPVVPGSGSAGLSSGFFGSIGPWIMGGLLMLSTSTDTRSDFREPSSAEINTTETIEIPDSERTGEPSADIVEGALLNDDKSEEQAAQFELTSDASTAVAETGASFTSTAEEEKDAQLKPISAQSELPEIENLQEEKGDQEYLEEGSYGEVSVPTMASKSALPNSKIGASHEFKAHQSAALSKKLSAAKDLQLIPTLSSKLIYEGESAPLFLGSMPLASASSMRSFGIDAMRISMPLDFQGSMGMDIRIEHDLGRHQLGWGLGFAQEQVPYSFSGLQQVEDIVQLSYWNVDTAYDIKIDSSWVILGINQGQWQVDTFYQGRLDSNFVTRTDTQLVNELKAFSGIISSRSLYLPLSYSWIIPHERWDFRIGAQGSLGMTETVERVLDADVKIERSFRYTVGAELGADYYFLPDWALGISWNPRYRAFSEARLEDQWQWDVLRLQLRYRF